MRRPTALNMILFALAFALVPITLNFVIRCLIT